MWECCNDDQLDPQINIHFIIHVAERMSESVIRVIGYSSRVEKKIDSKKRARESNMKKKKIIWIKMVLVLQKLWVISR